MLALAAPRRSSLMPQVPTVQESGVPGYELSGWFGLLAPAKTPQSIVERLSSEVKKAVADPKLKDRLTEQGLEVDRQLVRRDAGADAGRHQEMERGHHRDRRQDPAMIPRRKRRSGDVRPRKEQQAWLRALPDGGCMSA